MVNKLVAIDTGNSGTSGIRITKDGNGRIRSSRIAYNQSVRRRIDHLGHTFDGESNAMELDTVIWNGNEYIFGDHAVQRTYRHDLDRGYGVARYGTDFHRFCVAMTMRKLKVSGKANIVMLCPPDFISEYGPVIKDSMKEPLGFIDSKATVRVIPKSVRVIPEGYAALMAVLLDKNGQPQSGAVNTISGRVYVMDVGLLTVDVIPYLNGQRDTEAPKMTWEDYGVDSMRQRLLGVIHDQGRDWRHVQQEHVDLMLRTCSLSSGGFNITNGGNKQLDMTEVVIIESEFYTRKLMDNIIDFNLQGFDGVDKVLIVGGGIHFVHSGIKERYGNKILSPEEFGMTLNDAAHMNAIGAARWGISNGMLD